jgi:KAP family P-loop domain
VGTEFVNTTAAQNSTDSNQSGQTNNVARNNADPAQNAHSSSPDISASTNNGHASSSQHVHDDSRTLDKIGGPRRFEEIRKSLSYTPEPEKIHSSPPPPNRITSFQSHYQKIVDATKLPEIRAGLSYDPSVTDKRLDDLTDKDELYWAKVAVAHCPMIPLTHPTIWFNAWKFDQEEQLWAALAIEVMNQIKQKYGKVGRFFFWARLTWKRSSRLAAFWSIIWRLVLPIVLLVITVIYTLYLTSITNATASSHIYDFLGVFSPFGRYAAVMPLILFAGAILSGLPAVKIIKDPFQITTQDIFDKPNYKDKVGFIGDFQNDFNRIVSVATRRQIGWKPRKLVIFIDDLDRCEPPKAADIIEGINLFLDSDRCVFVLGMDPNAVAASIENKYKDLFEKMRRENAAVVSPGRLFLDKIIQVPFNVPPTTQREITNLMSSIMLPKVFPLRTTPIPPSNGNRTNQSEEIKQVVQVTQPEPTQPSTATPVSLPQKDRVDLASYGNTDIREAIYKGAKLLPENPRLVKKYMNLFRFNVYIASERKLLWYRQEGTDKPAVGLTLDRLAIWVAWTVRWAEIARPLSEEVQMTELRDYLMQLSSVLKKDGLWCLIEEAAKVHPNIFGQITSTVLMEEFKLNKDRTLVYEKLIERIVQIRDKEKNAPSHWSYLPWEWWLLDINFRKGIWEMQTFWKQPQIATKEDDWLKIVLTMTRNP